jgi:hypothetical protein
MEVFNSDRLVVFLIGLLFLERIHEIGDYWLQNSWMAYNKGLKFIPAFIHSCIYYCVFSLFFVGLKWINPFLVDRTVGEVCLRIFLVGVTHFLIDHYQLPALYCFWLNGKLKKTYVYKGGKYQLFSEKATWQEFQKALKERRWSTLPPPVPPFVILAIDQSWHKTLNAIAFILFIFF